MKKFGVLGLSLLWVIILGDAYPKICNSGKDCKETECCRAVMGPFLRRCLPLRSEGDWCIPKERKTPFGDIYFGRCPCASGTICSGETVRNKHGKEYIRNAHCRKALVSKEEIIPSRNGNFENFFHALHNAIHKPRPVVVIERPSSIASEIGGMPVKDTESSAHIESLYRPQAPEDSKVKLENEAKVSGAVPENQKKNTPVSVASSEGNNKIPSADTGENFLNSGSEVFNDLKEENKGSSGLLGQSASQSNNVAGEHSKVQSGQGDQSSQVYPYSQQVGKLGQSGQSLSNSEQFEQGGKSGQNGPNSEQSGQEGQFSKKGPNSELSGQESQADQTYLNSETYEQEGQYGQGQSIQSYAISPQSGQVTVQKEDQKYSNSLQGGQKYDNEFNQINNQFSNEGPIPNDLLSQEEIVGTDETHPSAQSSKEQMNVIQSPNELMGGQIPSDLVHQEEIVSESEKLSDESTVEEKGSIKSIEKEDSSKSKGKTNILNESVLQGKVPDKQEPAINSGLNEDFEDEVVQSQNSYDSESENKNAELSTENSVSLEDTESLKSSSDKTEGMGKVSIVSALEENSETSGETEASDKSTSEGKSPENSEGEISGESESQSSEQDSLETSASQETKEDVSDKSSFDNSEEDMSETSKVSKEDSSDESSLEDSEKVIFEESISKESNEDDSDKSSSEESEAEEGLPDKSSFVESEVKTTDESVSSDSAENISDKSVSNESEEDSSKTEESAEDSSNTEESAEDSSDTQENEEDSSDTQESEEDSSDNQESGEDSSDTQESEDDSSDSKESEEDSTDTQESEEDDADTQESKEDNPEAQESKEDGADIQESEEDSSDTHESEEDSSDTQENEDDSSNIKESEQESTDTQESKEDGAGTQKSEEDNPEAQESKEDNPEAQESKEDGADIQESEEDSSDTHESEEDSSDTQENEDDSSKIKESEEDSTDTQESEEDVSDKSFSQENDEKDGKSEAEQENEEGKIGEEHEKNLNDESEKDNLEEVNEDSGSEGETSAESPFGSVAFQDRNLENSDKADDALDQSKSLQKGASDISQEREDETSDGLLDPTETEEFDGKPSDDTSKLEEVTSSDRDIETYDAVLDTNNDFMPPEGGNYDDSVVSMDPESLQKYYIKKYAPTDSA